MTVSASDMHTARRRIRPIAALALLGVMWLGSACHFWHHFVDPECGAATTHGVQPCATCAAFHGGTIVGAPQASAVSAAVSFAQITLPETERPTLIRVSGGSPRAPPTA